MEKSAEYANNEKNKKLNEDKDSNANKKLRGVIAMYSPEIEENHIRRLFQIKEAFKSMGERVTMVDIVKEALERYLTIKEEEVKQKLDVQKEATDG